MASQGFKYQESAFSREIYELNEYLEGQTIYSREAYDLAQHQASKNHLIFTSSSHINLQNTINRFG